MKRIIIIGGMGPQASLELHRRIIKRASENGAKNGSDFPSIVHFSLPVDDFIADRTKMAAAVDLIVDSLRGFHFRRDDTIIMACNTAHLLQADLERKLGITITSLVDLTVDFVARNHKKVQLLASPTTIKSALYTDKLTGKGVGVVLPSERQMAETESIIRQVIAGEQTKPIAHSSIPRLLGCTELSCAFGAGANSIDPLAILIDTLFPKKEVI